LIEIIEKLETEIIGLKKIISKKSLEKKDSKIIKIEKRDPFEKI